MTLHWFVLLVFIPAITAQGQAYSSGVEASRDPRLQAVRARYDSGFARVVAAADTASEYFAPLGELARFKNDHVAWAVQFEDGIYAMSRSRARGWLVVVPMSHPALAEMTSVLGFDETASVPAVRVKPDLIAPMWAGIFLTYELSHLADAVLSILPPSPTEKDYQDAEMRAYGLEFLAAIAAGGPAYIHRLDSLTSLLSPKSLKELAAGAPSLLRGRFHALDSLFGTGPALSEREEQRRAGVFAVGLLFRFAQVKGLPASDIEAALHCLQGCPQSP